MSKSTQLIQPLNIEVASGTTDTLFEISGRTGIQATTYLLIHLQCDTTDTLFEISGRTGI
jgi:hypothetical protein